MKGSNEGGSVGEGMEKECRGETVGESVRLEGKAVVKWLDPSQPHHPDAADSLC